MKSETTRRRTVVAKLKNLTVTSWFSRLRRDRSVSDALFIFILTRSIIFLIFVTVGHLNVVTIANQPTNVHEAFVSFERVSIARKLRETMWRGDVAHYMDLARDGYLHAPFDVNNSRSTEFAFFPLYPFLLWLIGRITTDVMLVSAALSNLFLFLALVLLHKLTLRFGYDQPAARRTIFYLAAFPVSYFFSVPMTESLFLFLTVWSFYEAKQERWWTAGIIGAFASATRVNGVLLLPALLILNMQQYRTLKIKKALGLLLVPVGLWAFMFYAWWLSGNAWAFKDSVAAWGRKPSFFLSALGRYLIHPHQIIEPWNFNLLNAAVALLSFAGIYILIRRREWALAVYVLLSVLLALSSGLLQSFARYALVFFPVFMAPGIYATSERLDQTIRFVLVILLGLMTALFAANFSIAVT